MDTTQPGLNQVNPQTTFNQQVIADQVKQDIPLAKEIIQAAQKKDIPELVELGIKNRNLIENQVTEVENLVGQVQAGWKEPALWVILAFLVFNVYCTIKGIPMDIKEDGGMGALVLGYLGHRHQMTK